MNLFSQSGGVYQIEKSVVTTGGGANEGGSFLLGSTSGQPLAGGFSQGAGFSQSSGFWTPVFTPTAARVSIGGRVRTAGGRGIRNVGVQLTAPDGTLRFTSTGSFGYYRFNDLQIGETYVLTVSGKRYVFENPTLIVNLNEQLENLDFTANGDF